MRPDDLDPANFASVGAMLRAVREHEGLPIEAVSEQTHVKPGYLEASEDMRHGDLPAPAFALGFVRVYAEALGLEPGPVVARFKTEVGVAPAARAASSGAGPAKAEEPPRGRPDMSLLAVLAVTAFFVWCAFWVAQSTTKLTPINLDAYRPTASESFAAGGALGRAPAGDYAADAVGAPAVLVEAEAVDAVSPVYPPICETAAADVEYVDVAFTVSVDGRVSAERVTGATNDCFKRAALNALRQWRFQPRRVDGAPQPAYDQRHRFAFKRPS
ncbi:MAG: TonB family protein [Parvularculaceae bacterium]